MDILNNFGMCVKMTTVTGFVKNAHKHVHFFWGLIFNILFSNFEVNVQ